MSGTTYLLLLAAVVAIGMLYTLLRYSYNTRQLVREVRLDVALALRQTELNERRIDRNHGAEMPPRTTLKLVATGRRSDGVG